MGFFWFRIFSIKRGCLQKLAFVLALKHISSDRESRKQYFYKHESYKEKAETTTVNELLLAVVEFNDFFFGAHASAWIAQTIAVLQNIKQHKHTRRRKERARDRQTEREERENSVAMMYSYDWRFFWTNRRVCKVNKRKSLIK